VAPRLPPAAAGQQGMAEQYHGDNYTMDALDVLYAQLTLDLFAVTKFLVKM